MPDTDKERSLAEKLKILEKQVQALAHGANSRRVMVDGADDRNLRVKPIPCEITKAWKLIPLTQIKNIEFPAQGEDQVAYCLLAAHPIIYLTLQDQHEMNIANVLKKCKAEFDKALFPYTFSQRLWDGQVVPRAALTWAQLDVPGNEGYLVNGSKQVGQLVNKAATDDGLDSNVEISDYSYFNDAMKTIHHHMVMVLSRALPNGESIDGMFCDDF